MTQNLNSLAGVTQGIIQGTTMRVMLAPAQVTCVLVPVNVAWAGPVPTWADTSQNTKPCSGSFSH